MRKKIGIMMVLMSALMIAAILFYWDNIITVSIISLSNSDKPISISDRIISLASRWMIFSFFLIWGILHLCKLNRRQIRLNFFHAIVAAILGYVVSQLIQGVWDIRRPFVVLGIPPLTQHKADPSFPSDYAVVSYAFATALTSLNPLVGVLGFATATAVGFTRVYCRLHWVSDVFLGGLVVGGLSGIASDKFLRLLNFPIPSIFASCPQNRSDNPTTASETP